MRYDPGRDLRWLLLRPWIAIPRLIQVLWSLGGLVLVLLLKGGSSDSVSYTHLTLPTTSPV